jgi:hypothetical protein
MNEQIRQLAEQAGLTTVADVYLMKKYMPNEVKFAELIVEECLYIVEGEDDGSADTKSVRLAMIRMKKHFGVEE